MSRINEKLEIFALEILTQNDMLRLPVDLAIIASNNDIEVYKESLPNGISGAIKYNRDINKFQILIEKFDSFARQRFTLAHELAHFFLEDKKLQKNGEVHFDQKYRKTKNRDEEDVEYLAGAILMNKDILTSLYEINPSISELSNIFKVSESAMTVRLKILGLTKW